MSIVPNNVGAEKVVFLKDPYLFMTEGRKGVTGCPLFQTKLRVGVINCHFQGGIKIY